MIKKFDKNNLKKEYGLSGIRTFPWKGIVPPFGGGYCIVKPNTDTYRHVNDPEDEDEMFIAIKGKSSVFLNEIEYDFEQGDIIIIPRGVEHFIRNSNTEEFHFYTIWWSMENVNNYLGTKN